MPDPNNNIIDPASTVIRDLAFRAAEPPSIIETWHPTLKVSRNKDGKVEITDLEKYQPTPRAIVQTVHLSDDESFAAYVNRYKTKDTVIFFDGETDTFRAIMDYHSRSQRAAESGEGQEASPEKSASPQWGNHVAVYTLATSQEWDTWDEGDGSLVPQQQFGDFLDENRQDVVNPDGATLLEMTMKFDATKNVTFLESSKLQDRTVSLKYTEDTNVNGTVKIPESFDLSMPVYFGEQPQTVTCRFYYKIENRRLTLGYKIMQKDRILQRAAAVVMNDIAEQTKIQVFQGKRA